MNSGDEAARSLVRSIDRTFWYFQSKKRKWRPVNLERVYFLALPLKRKVIVLKDPFKVAKHALTYIMSNRMERLASRKIRPEIPLRIPGAVSPAAMKAIGSNTHFATTFTTVTICFAVLRNSSASISSLDIWRNCAAIDPKEATFSLSPMQLCRVYRAPILLHVLLDVVSKLIRRVSQRTSSRRDSTRALTAFFPDERFMRKVTLFVRNF